MQYFAQPELAQFALNILAIPLISAECKRVFSSAKHLVTNSHNHLKADIIEANKCLKSWYGCPKLKAFGWGVDPDINDLYEEEIAAKAAAKAAAKTAAKKDSNAQGNVDQEAGEGGEQKGQGNEGDEGDEGNKGNKDDEDNKDDESQEEDKGNKEDSVKYIVVDDWL